MSRPSENRAPSMGVYLDDSGDAGFKFDAGSSTHLVFSSIVFDDAKQISLLADAVGEVRDRFNISREFKFNKTSPKIKKAFFEAIEPVDFRVRTIHADKREIYSPKLRTEPAALKSYLIRMLLTKHHGCLENAKVFIDGQDTKGFGVQDEAYFARMVNGEQPGTLHSVRFVDSQQSIPIQTADMIAGATLQWLKKGETKFTSTFRRREWQRNGGTCWDFTRK